MNQTDFPIYYIGTSSENPCIPSWADIPSRPNIFDEPENESIRDEELTIATSALSWDDSDYALFYSYVFQQDIAKKARSRRIIALHDLMFLLAKDDECSAMLPSIWTACGFDEPTIVSHVHILKSYDSGSTWERAKEFALDHVHTRAMAWFWILREWTATRVNYFFRIIFSGCLAK